MSNTQSTLTFRRFGATWVVTGPVDEVAAAMKAGKATVTMRDGTDKVVKVDTSEGINGLYETKNGKTQWTYQSVDSAAFHVVDDRDKSKGKGKGRGKGDTGKATTQASSDDGPAAAILAALAAKGIDIAALLTADTQATQAKPASKPASKPATSSGRTRAPRKTATTAKATTQRKTADKTAAAAADAASADVSDEELNNAMAG